MRKNGYFIKNTFLKTIIIIFGNIFMLLFFYSNGFSAQSEIDRCISRIEKKYSTMNDFHARFEQETFHVSLKTVKKGGGDVYFKKGGKMLWDYKAPEAQKIILDGKNLWFYIPSEKQVMKNNFSTIPTHIVVDLFRGQIDIQQKFKVVYIQNVLKDKKSEIEIELIPIIYDPTLKRLILWINPETYIIIKSSIEDEFGNKTSLTFLNIEVDMGIDNSLFNFVPPPDVEIFEPPNM
jgi:outer membrane lipoprotein carrier protein